MLPGALLAFVLPGAASAPVPAIAALALVPAIAALTWCWLAPLWHHGGMHLSIRLGWGSCVVGGRFGEKDLEEATPDVA